MIATGLVMSADNAAVVRYIQDQPIVFWAPAADGFVDGRSPSDSGKLTEKQIATVEREMRAAGWLELERFEPRVEIAGSIVTINLCPDVPMSPEFLKESRAKIAPPSRPTVAPST